MGMPTGDSPRVAQDFYLYLQSHQQAPPNSRVETWKVDGPALLWLWGFVVVVALILFVWIREYRSHHPREPISPLDRWGGYATESAGHVPLSFWVILVIICVFGAQFIVAHLIGGQLF